MVGVVLSFLWARAARLRFERTGLPRPVLLELARSIYNQHPGPLPQAPASDPSVL